MKVFVITIIGVSQMNVSVYKNKKDIIDFVANKISDYYDWPVDKNAAAKVKKEYDAEVKRMSNSLMSTGEYEDEIGFQYMINECEVK